MNILGISAFYHDSAACLIINGEIKAAAQEERFSRRKHDASFPINAIRYCLEHTKITASQIDYVAFYDKPFLKFERILETYLAFAPSGLKSFTTSLPSWIKEKLFQKNLLEKHLSAAFGKNINWKDRLLFSEHHLSHAASAFFPSPFESAAVLTLDGVGEWVTTSLAIGQGNSLDVQKEIHFPHSLGLLYSAMTYYTGFKVNSGEYKLMGLAPYGKPIYADLIRNHLIDIKEDGSFFLNMNYFSYCTDLTMTNHAFNNLFGGTPRKPESEITQKEMDLAASIQVITEDIVIRLAKDAALTTGLKNLCLAGGVALNCVANGKLLRQKVFNNIWIQPASGDSGGAIGAALGVHHILFNQPRNTYQKQDQMHGSYLGPNYTHKDIVSRLNNCGATFEELTDGILIDRVALSLSTGKAIGWMQDRMEFGPRALGNRSIIADPRSPKMQKTLNLKVKFRESFRPFAPSVLAEDAHQWFDIAEDSPYMLFVANVHPDRQKSMTAEEGKLFGIEKLNIPRSDIPAVTHVDYSARIQTVREDTNPRFHQLIKKFKEITGCPVLINTSFNIRGEPIVNTPEEAFNCFMGTELDALVIGNCYLEKSKQNLNLLKNYTEQYELD